MTAGSCWTKSARADRSTARKRSRERGGRRCSSRRCAVNDYEGLGYALSYWRTTAGAEVDLVAYGERGLLAFEVKRTGRLRREDGAGLRQFARDYPPAKCFLLYGGDRREYRGGVEVWPLAEALRCLPSILAAGAGGG